MMRLAVSLGQGQERGWRGLRLTAALWALGGCEASETRVIGLPLITDARLILVGIQTNESPPRYTALDPRGELETLELTLGEAPTSLSLGVYTSTTLAALIPPGPFSPTEAGLPGWPVPPPAKAWRRVERPHRVGAWVESDEAALELGALRVPDPSLACLAAPGCLGPRPAECPAACADVVPARALAPTPPVGPSPVDMRPCPSGFVERSVDGDVLCAPWATTPEPCDPEEYQPPGVAGCVPIATCAPVVAEPGAFEVYVRPGAQGSGTADAPFGEVDRAIEAIEAASPARARVVLLPGEHALGQATRVDTSFVGTCPAEVRLTVSAAPRGPATFERLTLRAAPRFDGPGPYALRRVSLVSDGLAFSTGARLELDEVKVAGQINADTLVAERVDMRSSIAFTTAAAIDRTAIHELRCQTSCQVERSAIHGKVWIAGGWVRLAHSELRGVDLGPAAILAARTASASLDAVIVSGRHLRALGRVSGTISRSRLEVPVGDDDVPISLAAVRLTAPGRQTFATGSVLTDLTVSGSPGAELRTSGQATWRRARIVGADVTLSGHEQVAHDLEVVGGRLVVDGRAELLRTRVKGEIERVGTDRAAFTDLEVVGGGLRVRSGDVVLLRGRIAPAAGPGISCGVSNVQLAHFTITSTNPASAGIRGELCQIGARFAEISVATVGVSLAPGPGGPAGRSFEDLSIRGGAIGVEAGAPIDLVRVAIDGARSTGLRLLARPTRLSSIWIRGAAVGIESHLPLPVATLAAEVTFEQVGQGVAYR